LDIQIAVACADATFSATACSGDGAVFHFYRHLVSFNFEAALDAAASAQTPDQANLTY
jgi:hypothetical protein